MPDRQREVDGGGLEVEARKKLADGKGRASIRPAHGEGYSLPDVVLSERVAENAANSVRMGVDEAGQDRKSFGVQAPPGTHPAQITDCDDAVAENPNIRDNGLAAESVINTAAFEDHTKGRGKNNYQVFVVIHLLQG